mmetsp:Transcript_20911/g.35014  ORF Transcript_20911/g.35014 Transcript_20911/m.35014 type:complete len:402 (-) Transcript_20911:443-1648(-)|eukprot:CAMPEP_0198213664 /NCGR_PEP_ID=MMETSP1445-20131203/29461_1 /TAXON_ID=36898 /ORGANISM="Pyramimonas sp., Strain CCMP2087" /LENGTH=401 /DNA_ID=CAMNT_0043888349 /DNA_START=87 /DNA_END=1292 /DNA_ORIENTATION=-
MGISPARCLALCAFVFFSATASAFPIPSSTASGATRAPSWHPRHRGSTREARALGEVSHTTRNHQQGTQPSAVPILYDIPPPPEDLGIMALCAEKCKHIPEMCSEGLYNETHWPAPVCLSRSTTLAGDLYYLSKPFATGRHETTKRLVQWAARAARIRYLAEKASKQPNPSPPEELTSCEQLTEAHAPPMMYPEEFEMMVKTLARIEPRTYLEWGSGSSTSFYPLMASGEVRVIDNNPPWCEKVASDPVVNCVQQQQNGRLRFFCNQLKDPDGKVIPVGELGYVSGGANPADALALKTRAGEAYVEVIDTVGIQHYDAALVDGRYRIACALKLLHYLSPKSVLFVHDFWLRTTSSDYKVILDYYDVLGYARSLAVLRKKSHSQLPQGWATAYKLHLGAESK